MATSAPRGRHLPQRRQEGEKNAREWTGNNKNEVRVPHCTLHQSARGPASTGLPAWTQSPGTGEQMEQVYQAVGDY